MITNHAPHPTEPIEFVRRDAARKETGLSESTINELIAKGLFPRPIRIGNRASGFVRNELETWKRARIEERNQSHQA